MRSRPVASDNLDGTRQDAQANLHNPVLESYEEEQKRARACEQRIRYGDIFVLLHLLAPSVKVDDAIRNLPDFYLYVGFDCTNKWANFLGDESRKQTIVARLHEALGVTETEIQFCREKVASKQWSLAHVAKALEDYLLGENSGAPCSLTEHAHSHHPTTCPAEIGGDTNPVLHYLTTGPEPAWTRRPCWEGRPGHSAMKPRLRNIESWRKQPLPTLKWTCRM